MLKSLLIALTMFAVPANALQRTHEEMPAMQTSDEVQKPPTTPPTSPPAAKATARPQATQYDPFAEIGRPSASTDIVGAEPGYQYTYAPVRDFLRSPAGFDEWRDDKARRGYEPRNGPRYTGEPTREHHATISQVEIWRRPAAVADLELTAEIAASVLDKRWAEHYFRHPGGLPDVVRDAMYAYHKLARFPDRPTPPSDEQIKRLVRREVKVHSGTRPRSWD